MAIDQILVNEAFSNNTFDLKILEETLNEVKQTSFDYLYNLQLTLTGYLRFDLKIEDLVLTKNILHRSRQYPRKYVANIKSNFIDTKNRLEFKKSRFYNKELSLFDVASNPDLFTHVFMVFIDGKFFDCVDIICKEDITKFIFDIAEGSNTAGIPKTYFDELKAKNADITIFFVPNCSYGIYNTNNFVLQKYIDNLSLKRFNIANNLDSNEKYITFINENDFLFSSVITDTENSYEFLKFHSNHLNTFNNKYIHLNIFGFRHLLDQIDISGNEKYFDIPLQDMPVPKENFMIFRNVDGKKLFAHDITINLYYPNIYEIIGNETNDDLTIYVFYSKGGDNVSLKFENELSLYYRFSTNILEKYKNNTIPDIIKNFRPQSYTYNIKDFTSSSLYDDHFKYKIDRLRQWTIDNNEVIRGYLNKQYKRPTGYYLDISKIDLSSKLREDNFSEIHNPIKQEIFDEPRYIFIFRNEFSDEFYHLRFFIDGILYVPDKAYKDSKYEYYYIPTSLVKPNSIFEIEKFSDLDFTKQIKFNNIDEKIHISLNTKDCYINKNDIFLITSIGKYYISNDKFSVFIKEMGSDIEINGDSFKEVKDFSIKLNDISLLNTDLTLCVRKNTYYQSWNITTEQEKIEPMIFSIESINDKRHFRVFRNGRLIPSNVYNIDFIDQLSDKFAVGILMEKLIGDNYVVDCSPYKYKELCHIEEIAPSGFVDLAGIINKPFDLKWYDIYLNGIKLNKTNIINISPTKIIIKNIETLKHLVVVEKNRDYEFFPIANSMSPSDFIWDNLPDLQNYIVSLQPLIVDNMDDIITNNVSEMIQDLISFYETVMKYMFIDPDEQQILDTEIATFPKIFDGSPTFMLNPDIDPSAKNVLEVLPRLPNE